MQAIAFNKTTFFTQSFLKPIAISLILAISAQINILTVPVPITLQSLVIVFIGLLCSPRVAALSVVYYLTEIGLGLPFASGFSGGLAALLSPRAGYFIGFLASTYTAAKILTYKRNFFTLWLAATTEMILLYACGITWLSILFGFEKALIVGLYPFISEIPAFIAIAVIGSYQANKLMK
ncbi:MAG: biotin transporter BioY [Alphaproteobacteria bacterium]|nr:biotin transporter BioY [Alphaproteobacteria bacterium]